MTICLYTEHDTHEHHEISLHPGVTLELRDMLPFETPGKICQAFTRMLSDK